MLRSAHFCVEGVTSSECMLLKIAMTPQKTKMADEKKQKIENGGRLYNHCARKE